MSDYIKPDTQQVFTLDALRGLFPRMSIPDGADLSDIGYQKLHPPRITLEVGAGQVLVPGNPELVDGKWHKTYDVAAATPEVPQQITRAQGKAALIVHDMWDEVLAYVAAIEDPTEKRLAEVALHDTLNWERSSSFLNAAADAVGITDEWLDQLFVIGSEIHL